MSLIDPHLNLILFAKYETNNYVSFDKSTENIWVILLWFLFGFGSM